MFTGNVQVSSNNGLLLAAAPFVHDGPLTCVGSLGTLGSRTVNSA